ncbi:unnamed protein product [Alternaria alternata]
MLDELVYYRTHQRPQAFDPSAPALQHFSYYPLKIVAAEWVNYIAVLGLSLREYELRTSLTGNLVAELESLNMNLRILQGWRRRILSTQAKLQRNMRFIRTRSNNSSAEDWKDLLEDYEFLTTEVANYGEKLEAMVPLVTSAAALIESRRALTETENIPPIMPRRPEEPSRTGYLAPQLRHLITSVLKIWTAIALGVKWIALYGSFILLYLLRPVRKENRSDAEHDRDTGPAASQHSWIITRLSRMPFTKPYSFWVPLLSTTLITVFSFHMLDSHYTPFDNTNDFATACPEDDRRTQTSAFVRLFAATVTTMCIHGHLSSLTGSDAWKREFFRMLEVLVNPLASLFAMADAVWYEIAGSLQVTRDSWDEKSSIRYRLACMCRIRIDTGQKTDAMSPAPYLMYINPRHVSSKLLERDLKWSGRAIVLGLGMAALQLGRLFGPSILMYLEIVRETRRWDAWDPSNPCLALWKDNLEDELWWF